MKLDPPFSMDQTQTPFLYSDAPETVSQYPEHEGLQFVEQEKLRAQESSYVSEEYWRAQEPSQAERGGRRIFGLTPCILWTIVAAVCAAAIAGIVGGVVGSQETSTKSVSANSAPSTEKSGGHSSSPTALTSIHSTQPSKTSTTPSFTTTEIVGPSSTLFRDCPSVDNTVYDYSQDGSSIHPQSFRQQCNAAAWNIHGISAVVNVPTNDLSSCLDLCGSYNLENQASITAGEAWICNAACWRNTFDTDLPGQCYGYSTTNVSGHWNVTAGANSVCDSGLLMNQKVITG